MAEAPGIRAMAITADLGPSIYLAPVIHLILEEQSPPMSDQVVNIPRERFEELASAPIQLAQMEAARMVGAGDVAGANRRIAEGVAQSAAMRAQLATQQPAAQSPVVQPATPAAPTASAGAPLAAPGSPIPHVAPIPTEPMHGENLGQFYIRRGSALRQAAQVAADGQLALSDLSRPMGLRRR